MKISKKELIQEFTVIIHKAGKTAENSENQKEFFWFRCTEAQTHPGFIRVKVRGQDKFRTIESDQNKDFVTFSACVKALPEKLRKKI